MWSFSELYVTVLSVNKSGCFWHAVRSRISVCSFCLLETTSLAEFMLSLPGSECWHFKISWRHCQEITSSFLGDIFWPSRYWISRRDLTWSLAEIRRVFGRRDLTWNLAEILGEILAADLGEFLAAEILRSRQDLGENLTRFWDLGEIFRELAEIVARISAKHYCVLSNLVD